MTRGVFLPGQERNHSGTLLSNHTDGLPPPGPFLILGNLEKLPFRRIFSLRNHLCSWHYHVYACGKTLLRASIINEISNLQAPLSFAPLPNGRPYNRALQTSVVRIHHFPGERQVITVILLGHFLKDRFVQ